MFNEHDSGDEHVDAPPRSLTGISALLAEWGDVPRLDTVSNYDDVRDLIHDAECLRGCCYECALEACGVEDGS